VSRRWAVNASPLIVLAKVGRVDVLTTLCDELVIPAVTAGSVSLGTLSSRPVNDDASCGRGPPANRYASYPIS
jgi:hypothetical protein